MLTLSKKQIEFQKRQLQENIDIIHKKLTIFGVKEYESPVLVIGVVDREKVPEVIDIIHRLLSLMMLQLPQTLYATSFHAKAYMKH